MRDPDATEKLLGAARIEGKEDRQALRGPGAARRFTSSDPGLREGRLPGDLWESLLLIVAAIIYFVSPVDAIPDVLPVGLLDDAVVIAFVIGVVKEELDDFMEWEKKRSKKRSS